MLSPESKTPAGARPLDLTTPLIEVSLATYVTTYTAVCDYLPLSSTTSIIGSIGLALSFSFSVLNIEPIAVVFTLV